MNMVRTFFLQAFLMFVFFTFLDIFFAMDSALIKKKRISVTPKVVRRTLLVVSSLHSSRC